MSDEKKDEKDQAPSEETAADDSAETPEEPDGAEADQSGPRKLAEILTEAMQQIAGSAERGQQKMAVVMGVSKMVSRAFIRVMKELGIGPDMAVRLWAYGLDLGPQMQDQIQEMTSALVERDPSVNPVSTALTSMTTNAFVKDVVQECPCRLCSTREAAKRDPEKTVDYARALIEMSGEDPGIVVQKIVAELEMPETEVSEIQKGLGTPGDMLELLTEVLKRGRGRSSMNEAFKGMHPASDKIN